MSISWRIFHLASDPPQEIMLFGDHQPQKNFAMPSPPTNPVPAAVKVCGALDCDECEAVPQQMKLIPRGNKKPCHPGALHYHFKRSSCRHYIEGTTPRKPGRQPRLTATALGPSRIPVGAMIRDDPCPQIIVEIVDVWACRCAFAPLQKASHKLTAIVSRAGHATFLR